MKTALTYPKGFRVSGIASGVKKKHKTDLMFLAADVLCQAAGVFTENRVKAHCVSENIAKLKKGRIRAVVANSGNANCMTGRQGLKDDRAIAQRAAFLLGAKPEEVLTASTGVIGVPLPAENIIASLDSAVAQADRSSDVSAAQAILTTDTTTKLARASFSSYGKEVRIGGVAKGSGMICPSMYEGGLPHATMLAFITTDAVISKRVLQKILNKVTASTFNAIDVDGDMSTNDMVLMLASGLSGASLTSDSDIKKFEKALHQVCDSLSEKIVADGEGATKHATIRVKGAATQKDALKIAKAISESNLVKTALYGNDANWGRIAAAAGAAKAKIDQERLSISIAGIRVLRNGKPVKFSESKALNMLKKKHVPIEVDLNLGKMESVAKTCDLSYDYIKINADYRT